MRKHLEFVEQSTTLFINSLHTSDFVSVSQRPQTPYWWVQTAHQFTKFADWILIWFNLTSGLSIIILFANVNRKSLGFEFEVRFYSVLTRLRVIFQCLKVFNPFKIEMLGFALTFHPIHRIFSPCSFCDQRVFLGIFIVVRASLV